MNHFSELPLSHSLQRCLVSAHLTTPTPVQAAAIPPALEGKDVLATAQTGTGKTLAFMLPVVERLSQSKLAGIEAIVLVPTRELAMQVVDTFKTLRSGTRFDCALVVGGLPEFKQLQSIRRGAKLLVATPGRLEDYLSRRLVRLENVKLVVLDEADRMLDMGFQPAIARILSAVPESHQTLCFSATLEKFAIPFIHKVMKDPVRVEVGSTSQPIDKVTLQHFEVSTEQKEHLLRSLLEKETGTFLVFAKTKHGTERLATSLTRAGYEAAMIHGDRTQSQRTAALKGFQSGKYRVLVATDVAARGIHVENIAHVVNFDLPQVAEDFIHRAGRTGRAKASGVASTFATRQEAGMIRRIERTLKVRMERHPVPKEVALSARENRKPAAFREIEAEPEPRRTARPERANARPSKFEYLKPRREKSEHAKSAPFRTERKFSARSGGRFEFDRPKRKPAVRTVREFEDDSPVQQPAQSRGERNSPARFDRNVEGAGASRKSVFDRPARGKSAYKSTVAKSEYARPERKFAKFEQDRTEHKPARKFAPKKSADSKPHRHEKSADAKPFYKAAKAKKSASGSSGKQKPKKHFGERSAFARFAKKSKKRS